MLQAAIVAPWRDVAKLIKNAGRKAAIDDIVCEMAKVTRLLDSIARKLQTAKSEKLLVEGARECGNPGPQFFRDEILKNASERVLRSVSLIARGFINESNNANASE